MNQYFNLSDKIYDITERYPALLTLLAANGFENLRNDTMRKTIGKTVSLETALRSKHLDVAAFEARMVEILAHEAQINATGNVTMSGILPCPIRLQLTQRLEQWIESQETSVSHTLQAASMGLDWLRDSIVESKTESDLSDIYLSAGFSLFYDRTVMGNYMEQGVFKDLTGVKTFHSSFDNPQLSLKDPLKRYTIIGVVPAVFMVNTTLLGDRKFPESWEDLLHPEFENAIALPMRDLDLFNAVLLGIYKIYGEEGVKKLGRGLCNDMHPAQMVKTGSKTQTAQGPVVTVMPYFFTQMVGENSTLKPVWPRDGAIISPIFLLTKASAQEKIQPLVDFIFSKEMGDILTASGKFPSTHPDVDNRLSADQTFMWPGWDFIHAHDISKILKETEQLFQNAAGGIA